MNWRRILGHRSVVVTALVVVLIGGYQYWSREEGNRKFETPSIAVERIDRVVVEFPFRPEIFHIQRLQSIGSIERVVGNTVVLRRTDVAGLTKLAREYWVLSITSDSGDEQ